jgi:hypothetical protein
MNTTPGMGGGSYELVSQYEQSGYIGKDGVVNSVSTDVSYFQLLPGSGSPQKKVPVGIQFLRDDFTTSSYGRDKEPTIKAIVDSMKSDPCTKAFLAAGLTPPSKLLEGGVFIGPASLLKDSTTAYMGTTEAARNRDLPAVKIGSSSTKAFTENDIDRYQKETVDGRPRIFLNRAAFMDGDYWLGDYIRHEFIHAGGAPAKWNPGGSDLYYVGYSIEMVSFFGGLYPKPVKIGPTEAEIIAACR